MQRVFIYLFLALVLSSCATREPLEFNLANITPTQHRLNYELRSISIKTNPAGAPTGDVDWVRVESVAGVASTGTGIPVTRQWEVALSDALVRSLAFTDKAQRTATLFVDIEKIKYSGFGTTHWDVAASYSILDRGTGETIFSSNVRSEGKAGTNEAFAGDVRGRLALVRAIRANIQIFMESLETASSNGLASGIR